MYLKSAVLLPVLATAITAHTTFTTLYVDGENQGDGVCIRMNRSLNNASFPIEPLSSKDVACGYDGEQGVSRVCAAKSSSTLTFEFREYADNSQPGSIDASHKGPCAVYMKKVPSAVASNNAAGPGWFKIWESTYDATAGKWCTEKLIENNGHLSARIPADIEPGYYLVRPELLALHAAQDSPPDPQFYVGCAQLFVQGDGTAQPQSTVNIGEGTYDLSMAGLKYNIYAKPLQLPYPMYGPPVYTPGSGASEASTAVSATGTIAPQPTSSQPENNENSRSCRSNYSKRSALVQTEGLKPDGCILERDNWCAFEVPSYTDQAGCWAASSNCWTQSKDCWDTVPPTGGSHCSIWDAKCHELDDSCNAGVFTGPPNPGRDLTPTRAPLSGSMDLFARDVPRRRYHL